MTPERMDRHQYRAEMASKTKPRKYRNEPTFVDGKRFDSKKEAVRYATLKLLEKSGDIRDLKLQPRYPLYGKSGEEIGKYVADFEYVYTATDELVTEDVKSEVTAKTRHFQHKKRHFERDYKRRLKVTI